MCVWDITKKIIKWHNGNQLIRGKVLNLNLPWKKFNKLTIKCTPTTILVTGKNGCICVSVEEIAEMPFPVCVDMNLYLYANHVSGTIMIDFPYFTKKAHVPTK